MIKKYQIVLGFILMSLFSIPLSAQNTHELYQNNRPPLLIKPYMELPIGAVHPEGWLKDQLIRMKNGMTGNLDSLYNKVMGNRNGWLGGDGDVWERGPYWIDGLLPLAYILDDAGLKQKVQPWIENVLKSQQPDGYFGPSMDREPEAGLQRKNAHDWWPKMVVLKYMKQYYDATGDERIIPFMTKYFHYQLNELPKTPLDHWTSWGRQRGGDNLMIVYWLYNKTGDPSLLDLGNMIAGQTTDWTDQFLNKNTLSSLFSVHCVNLAQAMKEPIIYYQYTKDKRHLQAIDRAMSDLKRTHGWPTGLYGGDEMLHTGNPTQGSELCTAVEMMFSLEKMLEITGNVSFADWLERVSFNALPTQVTDNYDARQYYQQLNQVQISRQIRNFSTSYNGTGQLFGLLTGYPCCTSNLHQGWPKFTKSLWFASEDHGLSALIYSPCSVEAKVSDGTTVKILEDTNYPFEETIRFNFQFPHKKVKIVNFPLYLRIPYWCKKASVKINGEKWADYNAGSTARIVRDWRNGDKLELELPAEVSVSRWYEASAAIERGPLLYALRIGEIWTKIKGDHQSGDQYGDWYYEVYPTTPWNYCLKENDLKPENLGNAFKVVRNNVTGYPWNLENTPIEIKAKGKRIKEWTLYNGMAGPLPYSPQSQIETSQEEDITLVPYGCTTLRITEFPTTLK